MMEMPKVMLSFCGAVEGCSDFGDGCSSSGAASCKLLQKKYWFFPFFFAEEAGQFRLADAVDELHVGDIARLQSSHVDERPVGENHVRRDAFLARDFEAERP